jgi:hypothetical protein
LRPRHARAVRLSDGVGFLLGGGYGALSWLAAPEPVKVAAKATPRPPPYKASSKETPTNSSAVNDSGKVVSGSNPPFRSQSERSAAASEQGAEARSSGLPQAQRSLAANAEVSPAEASQEVGLPAPAASPVSASNAQPAASAAPATAAKPLKRPQPRQARSRSEKSALALMTLRTIEFADGRRVTRLIPLSALWLLSRTGNATACFG